SRTDVTKVRIEGHSSKPGSQALNDRLGRMRAQNVKNYLVDQGIATGRLTITSYGEEHPLVSSTEARPRGENRRVEFSVVEIDGQSVE
ncbi:MAG: OmpA family protein, partial [Bradymonadaceae bacterium]